MAVTYPLTLPSGGWREHSMRLHRITGISQSIFTGEQQVNQHQGEWWECEVTLPPLTRAQASEWEAFFARLRGRRGTFLMGEPALGTIRGNVGTAYTTTSTEFDGTNDHMERDAELTGIADGKTGTISFWAKPDSDGVTEYVFESASGQFAIRKDSANRIDLIGKNASSSTILRRITNETITVADGWIHVVASWDLNAGSVAIYIDDVPATFALSITTNDDIDYTTGDWALGGRVGGSSRFDGLLSEFFFHTTFIDLTIEANRRKFITKEIKPADPGSDGSTPLGVQPLCYAPDGDLSDNKGSGGDFTITGAVTAGSTSPSDGATVDPKVDGGSQTGNELNADGFAPNQTGVFLAGDRIQIGTGASARYYMVTADANADHNGEATLDVEPAIVSAHADNSDIVYQSPVGLWRLTADDVGWNVDQAVIYGFSFPARSVI